MHILPFFLNEKHISLIVGSIRGSAIYEPPHIARIDPPLRLDLDDSPDEEIREDSHTYNNESLNFVMCKLVNSFTSYSFSRFG